MEYIPVDKVEDVLDHISMLAYKADNVMAYATVELVREELGKYYEETDD